MVHLKSKRIQIISWLVVFTGIMVKVAVVGKTVYKIGYIFVYNGIPYVIAVSHINNNIFDFDYNFITEDMMMISGQYHSRPL